MRGSDESDVVRFAQRQKKRNPDLPDPSENYRLAIILHSINGKIVEDTTAKLRYVRSLPMADTQAIRLAVEKVGGYIDLNVFLTCSSCGAENEMSLPMSLEFFRPTRG